MNTDLIRSNLKIEEQSGQPARKALRRLRWFKESFYNQINIVSVDNNASFKTDNTRLAECFICWLKEFELKKPNDPALELEFIRHASGMMLKQLLIQKPVEALHTPDRKDRSEAFTFWPEGYLYVSYCLNVRKLVMDKDFDESINLDDKIDQIGTWWSFKENVETERVDYAIPFLDIFAGDEPRFEAPGEFIPSSELVLLDSKRQSTISKIASPKK